MRASNVFFNVMTIIFLGLTALWIGIFFSVAAGSMEPPVFAPPDTDVPPTLLVPATFTPSATATASKTPFPTRTHTPSPLPSDTPTSPPPPTLTLTITNTPVPTGTSTLTPTRTLVPPTPTPTRTPTPTASATLTPTLTPTGPTAAPTDIYPFRVQPSSIVLRENPVTECDWQGVAGQITTQQGEPVRNIEVRVRGDDIGVLSTLSGTNPSYGPSGWEIKVADAPNNNRYQVELWANGVQVSPAVEMVFPNSCGQNLITINFIQTRPF
jgi:hypothetical protein